MDPIHTNRDQRPQRFAWAPGSYIAECSHCGKRFIGDKRARLCAPCAYNDEGAELKAACISVGNLAGEHERLRAAVTSALSVLIPHTSFTGGANYKAHNQAIEKLNAALH